MVYVAGGVFLRKKMGWIVALAVLICIVFGLQKLSGHLTERVRTSETIETAAKAKSDVQVILDPGHGGFDGGKEGINGAIESEINLSVALLVRERLNEAGITSMMTREKEESVGDTKVEDLKTRVSMINETKPHLAVSIHQNSYSSESIHGAQVFYYTHSDEGKKAALQMQTALLAVDQDNTRQAKENASYYLLKRTEVPTIIVECGFLSNHKEAEKLIDEEYQNALAEAIVNGIQSYLSQ